MPQVSYFIIRCEGKFSKVLLSIFKCTWVKFLLETSLASSVRPSINCFINQCEIVNDFVLLKRIRPSSHYAKFCLVCKKKSVSAKPFLVQTIFCTTKIFASPTKLQRFGQLALEAVKIVSGEKILCSLTSIRHWVIKFCNKWITKRM